MADLSGAVTREAVFDAVLTAKDRAAQNFTAQLWELRGRIGVGDLVVMPLKTSPHIAIGRVAGDYRYLDAEPEPGRRHLRPVQWLVTYLPRTVIKQDLLYSLGASPRSVSCPVPTRPGACSRLVTGSEDETERRHITWSIRRPQRSSDPQARTRMMSADVMADSF